MLTAVELPTKIQTRTKNNNTMSEREDFLKVCKGVRSDFAKVVAQYCVTENLRLRTETDTLLIMYDQLCERVRKAESSDEKSGLHLQNVSGSCTDGKHRRQITEKELKLAAKEVRLERGLIEYLINKVRKMQVNSGNYR